MHTIDDAAWIEHFRRRARTDISGYAELPIATDAPDKPLVPRELPRRIWIFWAQGWENAPEQSKICLESWRRCNPDWDVEALDDRSIGRHVDLGSLLDGKSITTTGRSNLLRLHLLAQGGVWADASTYCARPLSDWLPLVMQSGFFAFSRPGPDRFLSTWFLAAEPDNYLIRRWREDLKRYWRNVDEADFYHCTHYLFAEACRADPRFNRTWHNTPWISADGPHQVQWRADESGAQDLRRLIAERRVPVHKLERRRPTLPSPDAQTPLAWLLYGNGRVAGGSPEAG